MDWIIPMEPVLIDTIKQGSQWIHQVKWDGIRGLCYIEDNNINLYTKSRRERCQWYPDITERIILQKCKQAILDGELIVLDEHGKPSFHNIMSRERIRRQERLKQYLKKFPVQYMVFDILYKDGKDLRELPLLKRKEILESTLKSEGMIHIVSDYEEGDTLFSKMKQKNMEGIVSKDINSPYISGKKHRSWFKTKIAKEIIATVCGLKVKDNEVKSLVIGEYKQGSLVPIGSVSSGLSYKDRTILFNSLQQLKQETSSLDLNKNTDDIIWIKPVLNVLVSYLEREENGSLRHPLLVGFKEFS
jgi:bifunctional non-homologous end joining protein LigD